MADPRWCTTCNTYHYGAGACWPEWDVWCLERGDERGDSRAILATSAENAAERWAERDDSGGDYTIVGGETVTVCVARVGEERVQRYRVSGEAVPEYTAREVEEDDDA